MTKGPTIFRVAIASIALGPALRAEEAARPNVVLILVDDLGLDRLRLLRQRPVRDARTSTAWRGTACEFTPAYSACTVCSPTRASLLTGKYPARLHITDWIPGQMPANPKMLVPDWTKYLPLEEVTIADAFQAAGYATASIGKWHLGGAEYYPEKHGFDLNVAGTHLPQPPNGLLRTRGRSRPCPKGRPAST